MGDAMRKMIWYFTDMSSQLREVTINLPLFDCKRHFNSTYVSFKTRIRNFTVSS